MGFSDNLQKLMDDANVNTVTLGKGVEVTKRYLAIDDRESAEALRVYSPMDKKYGQTGVKVNRNRAYL